MTLNVLIPAHAPLRTTLFLTVVLILVAGCGSDLAKQMGVVTAEDLAGTYRGVLEAVTVPDLNDIADRSKHVIVDMDLLHELTLNSEGGLMLTIESSIVPKFRAIVVGIGSHAINLEFVEFEGLDPINDRKDIESIKVKQIVFVKHEGEWVFVVQMTGMSFEDRDLEGVNVVQYISYPSAVAQQMSESEAIQYVNTILKLASEAQRL